MIYFLSLPGAFLFSAFLWASFFVPLYLFALAYFLASRIFRKENLIILTLLILPFVTSSFWLQVLFSSHLSISPAAAFVVERLGGVFGGIILFLFLLLELLLILKVRSLLYPLPDKSPGGLLLTVSENEQPGEELPDSESAAIIDAEISSFAEGSAEEPLELAEVATSGTAFKEYGLPVEGVLKEYANGKYWQIDDNTREAAAILKQTLEEFKIKAEVTGIRKGPVITMFEILPAAGVKISRIANLADNIALRLAASRVRIVAPIPGKQAVGIEVPNLERAIVSFREMIVLDSFQKNNFAIPIVLGKDIAGEPQIVDLALTPHLLIAGATGSGKSVCVNSIICSILYRKA
ncbi:MAG: DNA translocase FtsK, partial [Spirochaeta sp.]|nr:DNA translocase FtsK [Spirochaeta sp.]